MGMRSTRLTAFSSRGKRTVGKHIQHYNEKRLHSAIGYVTPMDKLEEREKMIFQQRDKQLEEAREKRIKKITA